MSNIFDYLKWRGDLPLELIPFNEVDALVLSSFVYVRFTNIISSELDQQYITIKDAIDAFFAQDKALQKCRIKTDLDLLKILRDSKRFSELKCFYHKEVYDHENETQFGALSIMLPNNTIAVAYRGTDGYVAGWKEDLNLTYQIVPAQTLALEYLNSLKSITKRDTKFILMGHSKGGHLAMYAGAFANKTIANRIKSIYNFDGPGFDFKQFDIDKLMAIKPILKNYTPKWSFIGSFMQPIGDFNIIDANEFTVIQHDQYNWLITKDHFNYLEEIDKSALFIKDLLNKWLDSLNYDERKKFINAIYDVIAASKAKDVRDIIPNILKHPKEVQAVIKGLDEKTSQAISLALSDLRKIITDSVGTTVSNNLNQLFKRKD